MYRNLLPAVFWWAVSLAPALAAVERVSVTAQGKTLAGDSRQPSLSADGRFVAFASTARLAPDDRNTLSDVYVRDRLSKTTRRVSDDRGGDQPAISANGRFVVFRALDGLTRLRIVDLERGGIPVAAAIPEDTSNYDRPSDSGVISPDGRYVGYAYRPSPELVAPNHRTRGHQVMVTDLLTKDGPRVVPSPNGPESSIPDLQRVVISYDGELVVFQSSAPLTPDDLNTGPDIYLARRSQPGSLQRLSRAAFGLDDTGTSFSPAITHDGSRVFFISTAPLSDGDTDAQATLYVVNRAGNVFGGPIPILTQAAPVEISTQGSLAGQALAFLGKITGNRTRAVVLNLATGIETIVPTGTLPLTSAPALAGDVSLIAFAARTGAAEQVYVAPVPGFSARSQPTITLGASTPIIENETTVAETAQHTVSVSAASPGGGSIRLSKLERDGVEQARSPNSFATNTQPAVRGIYDVRARAFNDVWIEGTKLLRVIVQPAVNLVAISGVQALTRSPDNTFPDGRVNFSGSLRMHNTRNAASGALRVLLTDASTPAVITEAAASFSDVPPAEENVLTVIDLPALAASSNTLVPISGFTSPTERMGEGFAGRARTVFAHLRELNAGIYVSPENPPRPAIVLRVLPKLNENTDLPNGGVPLTGDSTTDANFNPQTIQSVQIQGRGRVGGPSRAGFSARAIFNSGNRACIPEWTLLNGSGVATISDTGVLAVGALSGPRMVTVHARFFGREATLPVTLFPLPPQVTLRAPVATSAEGGGAGEFRLTRTGSRAEALNVNYTLQGTAVNGADYQVLDGIAVIPPGASFVNLPITPTNDGELEGVETVTLRLLPDPAYRILGAPVARVTLNDDEPLPAEQPDLMLRLGVRPVVGAFAYQPDSGYDEPLKQVIAANGTRNRKVNVLVRVANRGTSAQVFTLQGSPGTIGFTIQYLSAGIDVTDAVVAGTFAFPSLNPAEETSLTVAIVPTAEAPVGATVQCDLRARSAGGFSDLGGLSVKRVR